MEYKPNEVFPCLAQRAVCSLSFPARDMWRPTPTRSWKSAPKIRKANYTPFFLEINTVAKSLRKNGKS